MGGSGLGAKISGVGRGLFWHNPFSKQQCSLETLTGKYLVLNLPQPLSWIRPLLRMIMLIALASSFIFCTHCPASNSLASYGQYVCKFICLLIKICCCCCWYYCRAQWEAQTVTHCPGWGGSKSWYKGHTKHTHWSHVYINSVRFIYLFIYLFI